jgi:hypothetical protein
MAEFGITYTLTTPAGTLTFNPSPSNTDGLYLDDVQGLDGGGVRGAVVPNVAARRRGRLRLYRDAAYPTLTGFTRAATLVARTTLHGQPARDHRRRPVRRRHARVDAERQRAATAHRALIGAVQIGNAAGVMKTFQVQLVAANPLPVAVATSSGAFSSLAASGGALVLPTILPFSFGDPTGGAVTVTPGGTVATYPVITVNGPITAPIVQNATTGKLLSLSALSVAAGDVLTIDMLNELVYVNSPSNSKVGLIDYAISDFWTLTNGVANSVRLSGSGTTGATGGTVTYHDAYL